MHSAAAKRKDRGSSMNNPTLPLELVAEILLRTPVRSVLRFRSVCKSWLSLISDPHFRVSHYDLAAAPTHRLLLRADDFYAQSLPIESPLETYHHHAAYFPLPLPSPPSKSAPNVQDDFHNQPEILGSCRGLVLLYYPCREDLIVWNPSTGVYKRFPNSNIEYGLPYHPYPYGFGYDPSKDDYLLVLAEFPECGPVETRICIFSFKTESWKTQTISNVSYEDLDDRFNHGDKFKAGLLFNGALHWLVFSRDRMVPMIIAFDLVQRSLSEIPLIDHMTSEDLEYETYSLWVMRGCLSLCCSVRGYQLAEVWVMKEYKVKSSWTMLCVNPPYDFFPICSTKDGGFFGSSSAEGERLEKLDHKGDIVDYHDYGGGGGSYCDNLQSAVYRESLLSLPSVVRETREIDNVETSEDDHEETSEDDYGETSEDDQQ
ncbi:F-box/kelch-repeat protein At3g23880 [Cajanus cajan]|nr:F-box/kelch-repeat protein At3g23880 [Cajanus cajan]